MLKELFSNRLFIGGLVFFVLCVGGSLLYQWLASFSAVPEAFSVGAPPPVQERVAASSPPASLEDVPLLAAGPAAPSVAREPEVLNQIIDEAVDRDIIFSQAGRFEALSQIIDEAVERGEFPHSERWSQLYTILNKAVERDEISSEERRAISNRYVAMLQTEGMSAWGAAQYFDRNGSPSREYLKEIAAQALAEDPDNPERLYFWAGQQDFVSRGPNLEREAAYEKLIARDDLPDKLRSDILDTFASTIWWDRPEDSIRYRQEAAELSDDSNYHLIGAAYQRLGQYQKALAIYRAHYAKTQSWGAAGHIRAIEEGRPLIPPIQRKVSGSPAGSKAGVTDSTTVTSRTEGPFDTRTDFPTRSMVEETSAVSVPDAGRAAAAAARAEYQRMVAQHAE